MKRSLAVYLEQCERTTAVLNPVGLMSLSQTQTNVIEHSMRGLRELVEQRGPVDVVGFEEKASLVGRVYLELWQSRKAEITSQHNRLQYTSTPRHGSDEEFLHQRLSVELENLKRKRSEHGACIKKWRTAIYSPPPPPPPFWVVAAAHFELLLLVQQQQEISVPMIGRLSRCCRSMYRMVSDSRPLWVRLFLQTDSCRVMMEQNVSACLASFNGLVLPQLKRIVILDWCARQERRSLRQFLDQRGLRSAYTPTNSVVFEVFLIPCPFSTLRCIDDGRTSHAYYELRDRVMVTRKALMRFLCVSVSGFRSYSKSLM